jgi:competence protein ComGF
LIKLSRIKRAAGGLLLLIAISIIVTGCEKDGGGLALLSLAVNDLLSNQAEVVIEDSVAFKSISPEKLVINKDGKASKEEYQAALIRKYDINGNGMQVQISA